MSPLTRKEQVIFEDFLNAFIMFVIDFYKARDKSVTFCPDIDSFDTWIKKNMSVGFEIDSKRVKTKKSEVYRIVSKGLNLIRKQVEGEKLLETDFKGGFFDCNEFFYEVLNGAFENPTFMSQVPKLISSYPEYEDLDASINIIFVGREHRYNL